MSHERLRKTGATLATMLAIGGLSAKSVEAKPLPKAETQAGVPALIGQSEAAPGLESAARELEAAAQVNHEKGGNYLTDPSAIFADAYAAYKQIRERWGGLVVVHAPKVKGASVGFYTSPHSAEITQYNNTGGRAEIDYGDRNQIITCYEPYLVHFQGKDYLAESSPSTGQYGYLDLHHAIKVGAITTYTLNGKRQKPLKFNPMKNLGIMPNLTQLELQEGYSDKKLREAWYVLPVVTDTHGKGVPLEAKYSKQMPHL